MYLFARLFRFLYLVSLACPLQVQGQKSRQDFIIGQVWRPPVGRKYGLVEPAMGQVEPCRPVVVKFREGLPCQFPRALGVLGYAACVVDGADAPGIRITDEMPPRAGYRTGEFEDFLPRPFGRGKPIVPLRVEVPCRFADDRLQTGERLGEGESFEAGSGGVARTVFQESPPPQRPNLMNPGLQDPEGVVVITGDHEEGVVGEHARRNPYKYSMLRNDSCGNISIIAGDRAFISPHGSAWSHHNSRYFLLLTFLRSGSTRSRTILNGSS